MLASGNLGLVYLMDERRRMTREEIDARHPRLLPELTAHPHVGWVLVRSEGDGALALGPRGTRHLADGRVEGEDPLATFSPNASRHLLRTDGFSNVADLMVGSFYDPHLDEGCAFEELISFHGGLGGPQTEPFILHPARLRMPDEPVVGAEAVNALLRGWRAELEGRRRPCPTPPAETAPDDRGDRMTSTADTPSSGPSRRPHHRREGARRPRRRARGRQRPVELGQARGARPGHVQVDVPGADRPSGDPGPDRADDGRAALRERRRLGPARAEAPAEPPVAGRADRRDRARGTRPRRDGAARRARASRRSS